jgi:hypothetical protein
VLSVLRLSATGLIASFSLAVAAQPGEPSIPGTWRAYPTLREVNALDATPTEVWAASAGGLFSYTPSSGEVRRFTTVEGLLGVDVSAVAADAARGLVWLGYPTGAIDRLDPASGQVTAFFDIERATQYPRRGVNRVIVRGDSLYIATDFGLVVFDPAAGVVRDTYSRLGPIPTGIAVYDALVAPIPDGPDAGVNALWLATSEGVVRARLDEPNLQQPSAWSVELRIRARIGADSVSVPFRRLATLDGRIAAGADASLLAATTPPLGTDLWIREPGVGWVAQGVGPFTRDIVVADGRLQVLVPGEIVSRGLDGSEVRTTFDGYANLRALDVDAGLLWVGDGQAGLFRTGTPPGGVVVVPESDRVVPTGPFSNVIGGVDVGPGGVLWLSHRREDVPGVGGVSGISKLDDTGWTIYSTRTHPINGGDLGFLSAHAAADGSFYAGSFGGGLTEITSDGTALAVTAENSTLRAPSGLPTTYIVSQDAVTDAAGRLWVINGLTSNPLHVRENGQWSALSYPTGLPASTTPDGIYVDAFDQQWLTLRVTTSLSVGRGVAVVSTSGTPGQGGDDRALHFVGQTAVGVGMPNDKAFDFAEDGEGRLWIGTERGVGVVAAPGSAFGGDPGLAIPRWPITGEGDSTSFFLRDFVVNAIARDPAGQLWFATTAGALLVNAAGDAILERFTASNSPLFSDNVVDVAVDEESGRVYFVTDRGALSYDAQATSPAADADDLRTFPSPFRPAEHDGVLISGLVAQTDVRILTLDGRLVARVEGRGGTAEWDGRDLSGRPVASGVYLVAARGLDGEGTAFGKVAVLR